MSQHDFDIANQGFAAFRADLNNALKALGSLSSGTAEPATTYANQLWYETDTNTLHIRNEANSDWLDLMVIDQSTGSPSFTAGNVGIGDVSPDKRLVVYSSSSPDVMVLSHATATTDTQGATLLFRNESSSGSLAGAGIGYRTGSAIDRGSLIFSTSAASNSPAERMRIDSSGNVGIGVTPSAWLGAGFIDLPANGFVGGATGLSGNAVFMGVNAYYGASAWRYKASSFGAGYYSQNSGQHAWFTAPSGTAGNPITFTQAMTLDESGNLFVGCTSLSTTNSTNTGHNLTPGGSARFFADATFSVIACRQGNDGTVISIRQAGVEEGTISVSGTTVSYNGGHLSRWAQFPDNSRPELLKGTVMSNLDQMSNWDNEDNEQLNCVEVSTVEGDPNVAGVFVAWDSTDDEYNDILLAMTGDMVIRIAAGTTVQRGDLLMSAGDGTAKPQEDDIVRSKTIAKVTSTHVSHTYEDGSYAVPCVLMAC